MHIGMFSPLRRVALCSAAVACFCLVACTSASRRVSRETPAVVVTASAAATNALPISPVASAYLSQALDYIGANSYMVKSGKVDWPALRSKAMTLARLEGVQTTEDVWPTIEFVLTNLGDNHSRLVLPSAADALLAGVGSGQPSGGRLPGGVGYLHLPQLTAPSESALGRQYSTTAQQFIREADAQATCGWIVDLRQNGGGDMWPMLAGVGPILGPGQAGSFVDAAGQRQPWRYQDSKALLDGTVMAAVVGSASVLKRLLPPVAILMDRATASAAEAVVVAFEGRPRRARSVSRRLVFLRRTYQRGSAMALIWS